MKKKITISLAVVLISAGVMMFVKYKRDQSESIIRVNQLAELAAIHRTDLVNLYQERHKLLLSWQKISKIKLPENLAQPHEGELKTESELKVFDQRQHQISNQFNVMLQKSESLKKKIRDLQIIEEGINRKRNEYHAVAFESADLIRKYRTGQNSIPAFPAEKLLHDHQK